MGLIFKYNYLGVEFENETHKRAIYRDSRITFIQFWLVILSLYVF